MNSNYIRTKDDYLQMIDQIKRRVGGHILTLPIMGLDQQLDGDTPMLETRMRTDDAHLLLQRLPRSYENPEGIQRAFKTAKIQEITKLARQSSYSAPGSIIGTLETKRPWVKIIWTDKILRTGNIEIDLDIMKSHLVDLPADGDGVVDDERKFKIGYQIDAHHRTEGHWQANRMMLEMATVLYCDLELSEMAGVFALVNEKQEKPSPTHTLMMQEWAGLLEDKAKAAFELANSMNHDRRSILHERIKEFDGPTPKTMKRPYVNMSAMKKFFEKYVITEIEKLSFAAKQAVLEAYFQGWKSVFPEAWDDEKGHVLVKAMGFSIMMELFPRIYEMAGHRYGETPNKEEFTNVIQILKNETITLNVGDDLTIEVPLDWSSATFGGLSSGKGISAVADKVDGILRSKRFKSSATASAAAR